MAPRKRASKAARARANQQQVGVKRNQNNKPGRGGRKKARTARDYDDDDDEKDEDEDEDDQEQESEQEEQEEQDEQDWEEDGDHYGGGDQYLEDEEEDKDEGDDEDEEGEDGQWPNTDLAAQVAALETRIVELLQAQADLISEIEEKETDFGLEGAAYLKEIALLQGRVNALLQQREHAEKTSESHRQILETVVQVGKRVMQVGNAVSLANSNIHQQNENMYNQHSELNQNMFKVHCLTETSIAANKQAGNTVRASSLDGQFTPPCCQHPHPHSPTHMSLF